MFYLFFYINLVNDKCGVLSCPSAPDFVNPGSCSSNFPSNILCDNANPKQTNDIVPCCGNDAKKCYKPPGKKNSIKNLTIRINFLFLFILINLFFAN